MYLVGNLELLALADVLGLRYCRLKSGKGLVVELLEHSIISPRIRISPPQAPSRMIGGSLTEALVTVSSTSPLAALIKSSKFSQTPFRSPKRLFSASVFRKFLTVSALSVPVYFCSSAMICSLSSALSVGACMMAASFSSLWKIWLRALSALATVSRVELFTAAVY